MSWHYSQALVEGYWGENSLVGLPSAQSRLSPLPGKCSWRDRMTARSQSSPFGMTYPPLMGSRGTDWWMSFLRDSRAKTSVRPALVMAWMDSAPVSGGTQQESFMRSMRQRYGSRTVQRLQETDLEPFYGALPKWGTMRNGRVSAETKPAHLKQDKDFGCGLSTLCASETKDSGTPQLLARLDRGGRVARNICARHWRHHLHVTDPVYLNPSFAEWLMGWPIGWTASMPLAMDRFQTWHASHGRP